jgi:hypothetical protein
MALHRMGSEPSRTLQEGIWGLTHLVDADDKFTKLIEKKPLAKTGSKQAVDFI